MSEAPFFSVVIPTYQRAAVLARAVESVLAQTFDDFELIVVDDGSTDSTTDVLERLAHPRLRALRRQHAGVSAARNAGADTARGRFLAFLDSDDSVKPGWLQALHKAIEPGTDFVSCGIQLIRMGSEVTSERVLTPEPLGPAFADISSRFVAGSFAVERSLFDAVGGYVAELTFSENTELVLRLAHACRAAGLEATVIESPLVVYNRMETGRDIQEQSARVLTSMEIILDRHREHLGRDRQLLGQYHAVAAVQAGRLRRGDRARFHSLRSIRAHPTVMRHWGRLTLVLAGPLGRLYWSHQSRRAAAGRLGRSSRVRDHTHDSPPQAPKQDSAPGDAPGERPKVL